MAETPETEITPETIDWRAVAKVASHVSLADIRLGLGSCSYSVAVEDIEKDWTDRAFLGWTSEVNKEETEALLPGMFRVSTLFSCVYYPGVDPADTPEPPRRASRTPSSAFRPSSSLTIRFPRGLT